MPGRQKPLHKPVLYSGDKVTLQRSNILNFVKSVDGAETVIER